MKKYRVTVKHEMLGSIERTVEADSAAIALHWVLMQALHGFSGNGTLPDVWVTAGMWTLSVVVDGT